MSSTLIWLMACIFIHLFIYLFMHSQCADASAGLRLCFSQTPTTLATVLRHMFHSVGQDESAHMHSLAIASTAGLYKMTNFIY